MDEEGEPDLLALLCGSDANYDISLSASAVECVDVYEGGLGVSDHHHPSPSAAVPEKNSHATIEISRPSMVGKVGAGRHGDTNEKALLSLHMRHCKALRREGSFRSDVANLLDESSFRKADGKVIGVRAKTTSSGVMLTLNVVSRKGNRYSRKIPWCQFLEAAYGKFKHTSHIAMAGDISRPTASFASVFVGSVYMGQQLNILSKMLHLTQAKQPLFLIRHLKWDETTLWTSLNPDQASDRVRSSWEIMVARQRIVLGWADGSCAILRIVMPPVALLAGGAHHMYYALQYHPTYKAVQEMLELLGRHAFHRVQIYESDGAYANERLIAHLIQKNKQMGEAGDMFGSGKYLVHVKCQNHQSQLINVALVAAAGNNILNRMYGMTVYIRNLGNWLRLKQALFTWVDENLCFMDDVMSPDDVHHHPAMLEMIDFLRTKHYSESKSEESLPRFEKAAQKFLEMFNGNSDMGFPCHRCTHSCFPLQLRHCQHRQEAVRK